MGGGRQNPPPSFCNFLTKRKIITKLDTNIVYPLTNILLWKYLRWRHIYVDDVIICKLCFNLCDLWTDQINNGISWKITPLCKIIRVSYAFLLKINEESTSQWYIISDISRAFNFLKIPGAKCILGNVTKFWLTSFASFWAM